MNDQQLPKLIDRGRRRVKLIGSIVQVAQMRRGGDSGDLFVYHLASLLSSGELMFPSVSEQNEDHYLGEKINSKRVMKCSNQLLSLLSLIFQEVRRAASLALLPTAKSHSRTRTWAVEQWPRTPVRGASSCSDPHVVSAMEEPGPLRGFPSVVS